MSTMQETLTEVSTFFEDTTKSVNGEATRTGLIEGEYLGHLANVRSIVRPVRKKYQARIYNFDVIVADENRNSSYQYEDITGKHLTITGEQFVGKKLIAKGIFKFLDPQKGDTFAANPSSNKTYSIFCDTLGIPSTRETRTIDGKETTVKLLPVLTNEDLLGKPVTATLKKVKDSWTNKETGQQMDWSWRVTYVNPWKDGKVKSMTVDKDDLPF